MKTKKLCYLSFVGFVIFLTFSASVYAADVYVRAGASGKGSIETPYGNLWKAVDRAKRGDVIHVAQGTYNGKGGCGHIKIKVPNLTLAGGYSNNFSKRDPFKNFTIIERAKDYRGDWTGLPDAIISGDQQADHSNLTVDGFVLNGESRNKYSANKILPKGCYHGCLFQTKSKNSKLLNSILLNPYGNGIYLGSRGTENEISNCFILNTFYAAISTRSAQDESITKIKNNTIAFSWFQPGKGGAIGIYVGRQGQAVIENNVISFLQTEGGASGIGIVNGFGNEDLIMKGNTFFSCSGGFYKFLDDNKASLTIWKSTEFDSVNDEDDCEDYMLAESGGNQEADPGMKPNKAYGEMFANFIASEPGKLNMGLMNEWRRSAGLPLQAAAGSPRENWALAYPLDSVVPNLSSSIPDVGVQIAGPFKTYKSQAAEAGPASYELVELISFKKGGVNSKGMNGKAVEFFAGMGASKTTYELGDKAPRSDYDCFELVIPGKMPGTTRDIVYGYLLKGSKAHKKWTKYYKKKNKYNKKGGIRIQGQVYDFKNKNYSYPVGVVINVVKKK